MRKVDHFYSEVISKQQKRSHCLGGSANLMSKGHKICTFMTNWLTYTKRKILKYFMNLERTSEKSGSFLFKSYLKTTKAKPFSQVVLPILCQKIIKYALL